MNPFGRRVILKLSFGSVMAEWMGRMAMRRRAARREHPQARLVSEKEVPHPIGLLDHSERDYPLQHR